MTLKLNGTNSEAAPAYAGDDADTGLQCGTNELKLVTGGTARATVDSSGDFGIGTSSPSFSNGSGIELQRDGTACLRIHDNTNSKAGEIYADSSGLVLDARGSGAVTTFDIGGSEKARLDNSGRLLVGTSSSIGPSTDKREIIQAIEDSGARICLGRDSTSLSDGFSLGGTEFYSKGGDGSFDLAGAILCRGDGTHAAGDKPTRFEFHTTADGSSSPTERFRINSEGRLSGGDALNPTGAASAKFLTINANYNGNTAVNITGTSGNTSQSGTYALRLRQNVDNNQGNSAILRLDHTNPLGASGGEIVQIFSNRSNSTAQKIWVVERGGRQIINRPASDGTLISLRQNNTQEGTISVSGSTVSYNGGHLARWSQLEGGAERTEILRGSVLSNLDEMCEWIKADTEELLWTQEDLDMYFLNGDEGLPGGAQVGDVKEPATSGVRENNEQLNRMKVSDVEGDVNVAGVFQDWDDDDDTYTNDFYCAMTGDFVIRIAQGTTVARGDLLMSAGDGTAKPQDDDIVRSKTIAKVTSTTVSTTYSDGSYCVPCVLMAC